MQVPIGLEGDHEGVIDVVSRTAFFFGGVKGEIIEEGAIPANLKEKVETTRQELIENLADVDEEVRRTRNTYYVHHNIHLLGRVVLSWVRCS